MAVLTRRGAFTALWCTAGAAAGGAWMLLQRPDAIASHVATGVAPASAADPAPSAGDALPDGLRLPLLFEPTRQFDPRSMSGRPWLLNVWASWCAPCLAEHVLWRTVAASSDVPIVGLAFRDDPRDAQEWLRRHGNPYAIVLSDHDGRPAAGWAPAGVPTTWLLDAGSAVAWGHGGALTETLWQREAVPRLQRLRRASR